MVSKAMKTVIILGASARAAAHSALRGGIEPYAIDLFADQDLAAVCSAVRIDRYPHGFLAALTAAPQAEWIYTGGLENHPRLVDRLAQIRSLAGNRGAALRRLRDPHELAVAASAAGCPMPSANKDAILLVKPRRGSGGLGIRFATPGEIRLPPHGCYLQEFIAGEAASAVFIGAGGQAALLGVTRQLLGIDFQLARPFLYVGSIGPLALEPAQQQALNLLGNVLATQFSLAGIFNVDFVRAGGRIRTLEVNPRYSASVEVLEWATGVASIPLHLAACAKAVLPAVSMLSINRYCGKAVVYATRDGIVPEELADLIADSNKPNQPPLLADLPRVGDSVQRDQPVLTVFAEGPSPTEVEAALRARVAQVQRTLAI
jgi:predicted ATP-grasp superfamily ATP-dependent carboligase